MVGKIFHQAALIPEELAFLQSLFDRLCEERGKDPKSPEGEDIASSLISLFQSGIQDERALLIQLNNRTSDATRRQLA